MIKTQIEAELKPSPEDAISSVKFAPKSNQFLLVGSWDCTLRLYDVVSDSLKSTFTLKSPILDIDFQDVNHYYSGGLDNELTMFDANSTNGIVLGQHENAIRCVEYCPLINGIMTGSWDASMRLWDSRSPKCCGIFHTGNKIYAMSVIDEKIVTGTAGRKILISDLRNMSGFMEKRESGLKYQTRAIRCFPNRQGFAVSSIEGRVAFEYFDPNPEIQRKKYAFKCHRNKSTVGSEIIYPVNAISFHNVYNTFATGGSDGLVNVWDGYNKKRLCQFFPYKTPVSSLCFSYDGEVIAIACSYMYEYEIAPNAIPNNTIYIRKISDQEVKPK